jgi:hypothetical protein
MQREQAEYHTEEYLNKMIGNPTGDKVERFIQGGLTLLAAIVYVRNLIKDD